MALVATNPVTALLACGGFRDHRGIVSALGACIGLTWQTAQGGGILNAATATVVLDGQGVTLAAAPADKSQVLVVPASQATPLTIAAGAGDTILGSANISTTRTLGLVYASGTKVWNPVT